MAENTYKSVSVTVAAGGRRIVHGLYGYIKVMESNLNSFDLSIDRDSRGIAFQGWGIRINEGFVEFEIINNNASALNVVIGFSKAEISDDRAIISGTVELEKPSLSTPSNPAAIVTAAAGNLLIAANVNRKYVEIFNKSTIDLLYTGTDNAGLVGLKIAANGGYYKTENIGAVYGASLGASIALADIIIIDNV